MPDRRRRAAWVLPAALGAAALAGAGLWSAYAADMERLHARLEGRSTVVESPYGSIEYALAGQGPLVLVIHGTAAASTRGWRWSARSRSTDSS